MRVSGNNQDMGGSAFCEGPWFSKSRRERGPVSFSISSEGR